MRVLRLIVLFLIASAGASAFAETADDYLPKQSTLDGEQYSKEQIVRYFLDAAFSKSGLNESKSGNILTIPHIEDKFSIFYPENLAKAYPWLYPHIFPREKLPSLMAVTKWNKPIRISFGMPNKLRPIGKSNASQQLYLSSLELLKNDIPLKDEKFKTIQDDVINLTTELTGLTGLNISYLPHNEETLDNYAEVRINFVPAPELDLNPNSSYKLKSIEPSISGWGTSPVSFRNDAEQLIKTGFVFTPNAVHKVDGYFLADSKNNIDMAFCFIWQGHEIEPMRRLVKECLVRAMGFPSEIRQPNGKELTPKSILSSSNGKTSIINPHENRFDAKLNEFDRYMINLLYRSRITAGMDYLQTQYLLLRSEN